jgi:ABC-type antimicrobial peptide transport system permease subunit
MLKKAHGVRFQNCTYRRVALTAVFLAGSRRCVNAIFFGAVTGAGVGVFAGVFEECRWQTAVR